jgi:hypothetical protein
MDAALACWAGYTSRVYAHSPPMIRSRENKDLLFYPGGEKSSVKIPNIKADIFFKSKNILFDSYIIGFWFEYPRVHIFSGTKMWKVRNV